MKVVCLSGSAKEGSTNVKLLRHISELFPSVNFRILDYLKNVPLFYDGFEADQTVLTLRNELAEADAVIISTPEYIYGIPAMLKNAFEWTTSSGELNTKRVLAIIYTPNLPRGEKALVSLKNSLTALDANVVSYVHIDHGYKTNDDLILLQEAVKLLCKVE